MKLLIIVVFITFLNGVLYAQDAEDLYQSKEQNEYYEKLKKKNISFKPVPKRKILQYSPKHIEVRKSKINNNPYLSTWEINQLEKHYVDSCRALFNPDEDSIYYRNCVNKILDKMGNISIGSVYGFQIVQIDSIKNPTLLLYEDYIYEDHLAGYWIAELVNEDWKYYHTGLTALNPFYIKPNSTLPFQLSENKIQVEAARIRQIQPEIQPSSPPEYELVEDNLLLEMDISQIRKDTDGDGLTDVEELKLFTDPTSIDTDNDGIEDSIDKIPLSQKSDSDLVNVYNFLLHDNTFGCELDSDSIPSCFVSNEPYKCPNEVPEIFERNYLIVNDDPALKSICSNDHRYVVLNSKEFNEYKLSNDNNTLEIINISPLFKVDDMEDTFIISISYHSWGSEHVIQKVDDGWIIKELFSWII